VFVPLFIYFLKVMSRDCWFCLREYMRFFRRSHHASNRRALSREINRRLASNFSPFFALHRHAVRLIGIYHGGEDTSRRKSLKMETQPGNTVVAEEEGSDCRESDEEKNKRSEKGWDRVGPVVFYL
jgi:hypothetical protein